VSHRHRLAKMYQKMYTFDLDLECVTARPSHRWGNRGAGLPHDPGQIDERKLEREAAVGEGTFACRLVAPVEGHLEVGGPGNASPRR
jgi:hypothetical protein